MDDPLHELDRLLSEKVEEAIRREESAFDQECGGRPLVLVGAGGLGRRTLAGLREAGVTPLAFADNDSRRWGSELDGVRVLSPEDAVRAHGESAGFVLTTWRSGAPARLSALAGQMRALGARRVVPFAPLYWKYPDRFLPYFAVDLPHKLLESRDAVRRAFHLLADDPSRREMVAQVAWRLSFDLEVLPDPVKEEIYFPPSLVRTTDQEVFVDAGAFDGDTLRALLRLHPRFQGRGIGFEPDPSNFRKLSQWRAELEPPLRERVEVFPAAVGDRAGKSGFTATGAADASVREGGAGGLEVEVVTLDAALGGRRISFLKVDTEGYEPNVLAGGRALIRRDLPVLALSAYHRQDHLWHLPALVHELSPRYRPYLRPHERDGFDLILYALPS